MSALTPAALYHRVSTLDQNPDLARDELRTAAARLGLSVALEVEETGSGARNDRPGLARVMDAAASGRVRAVLVWKLDRFGRSVLDLQTNLRRLRDAGARFVAITQGLDLKPDGDALSKLIFDVLAAVAEWERETIRERTRLGMDGARKRGSAIGRPRAVVDVARARFLLAQAALPGMRRPSLSGVARELEVSPRTLRRALEAA